MPSARASKHQSLRYHDLIVEMGNAFGMKHGWLSATARELGLDPSYVAKIVAAQGTQCVGVGSIKKACERLSLAPEFFDAHAGEPMAAFVRRRAPDRVEGAPDEFDVMRALDALDAGARARVKAWLDAREREEVV